MIKRIAKYQILSFFWDEIWDDLKYFEAYWSFSASY